MAEFSDLVGKVLRAVTVSDDKETIRFVAEDGSEYRMFHDQQCCESVTVEDVCGNLSALIGKPIAYATETSGGGEYGEDFRSCTWTFYNIGTFDGHVTIRWCGTSNGYYSESVDFEQTEPDAKETP